MSSAKINPIFKFFLIFQHQNPRSQISQIDELTWWETIDLIKMRPDPVMIIIFLIKRKNNVYDKSGKNLFAWMSDLVFSPDNLIIMFLSFFAGEFIYRRWNLESVCNLIFAKMMTLKYNFSKLFKNDIISFEFRNLSTAYG